MCIRDRAAGLHRAVDGKAVAAAAQVDFIDAVTIAKDFSVDGHVIIASAGGNDVLAAVRGLHGDALAVVGGQGDACLLYTSPVTLEITSA